MQPSVVSKILPFASDYFGKSITAQRDFLLRKINGVRRGWWKVEELRQLIFTSTGCACIMQHHDDCNLSCGSGYKAITLPIGVTGMQHVEWDGRRVDIVQSRHRHGGAWGRGEVAVGAGYGNQVNCGGGCRGAELMTEKPCTEFDIPHGYKGGIAFKALEKMDENAKLKCGVEYITPEKNIVREDILLSTDGNSTTAPVFKFLKITLPSRCGFIKIMTWDGYTLGDYHPSVTAPSHLRVRVDGLPKCRGGQLLSWEALQEPLDVVFDTDRVECDSEIEWRNSFMWLDIHFKTGRTQSEVGALEEALQFQKAGAEQELKSAQTSPVARVVPNGIRRMLGKARWLQRW